MTEEDPPFSVDDIASAEKIFGLQFNDEKREMLFEGLTSFLKRYENFNAVQLDNSVPPAFTFDPRPSPPYFFNPDYPPQTTPIVMNRPNDDNELAFLPLTSLGHLIRTQQISSVELTQFYLERLRKFDTILECVITYTEELAMDQAKKADEEIREGQYRGILHGIPYGIKDLFAHPQYPTSWGAEPYKDQIIEETATVIRKLDAAGAVMIAKLSLGALAMGDVWFKGTTKSPHNPEIGSSGSSAGSASAVTAGLVGFAIGTETLGSIISPATRCGATGLRPTFGRISRHGTMTVSWTMDKVGPICRYVEDCAIVFDTIYGADGYDPSVISRPFKWDYDVDISRIRVGYDPKAFDAVEDETYKKHNQATLDLIRSWGFELHEISVPEYPVADLTIILFAEMAAAFDEMTRTGLDDKLVRQTADAWPNLIRQARLIPAVEYIKANRVRRLIMLEMEQKLQGIDLYIAPAFSQHIYLTNLTGHPAMVLPHGFGEDGIPTSITFIGNLFKEDKLMQFAKYYQDRTSYHLKQPNLE